MATIVKPTTLKFTLPVVEDIDHLELEDDANDELSAGLEEGEDNE